MLQRQQGRAEVTMSGPEYAYLRVDYVAELHEVVAQVSVIPLKGIPPTRSRASSRSSDGLVRVNRQHLTRTRILRSHLFGVPGRGPRPRAAAAAAISEPRQLRFAQAHDDMRFQLSQRSKEFSVF